MSIRASVFLILLGSVVHANGQAPPKADDSAKVDKHDVIGRRVNFVSYDQEIALGREIALEFENRTQVLDDEIVREYIQRVGQTIVVNSDVEIPCTFKVVKSDDVNAFAVVGGSIYINRGLIMKAASEAELASVLAHLVADIAGRHGMVSLSKAALWNVVTNPSAFPGNGLSEFVPTAATLKAPWLFPSLVQASVI